MERVKAVADKLAASDLDLDDRNFHGDSTETPNLN